MTAQAARSTYVDNVTPFMGALTNIEPRHLMIPGADTLLATFASRQHEMLNFMAMRLERDGEAIQTIACRNWVMYARCAIAWVQGRSSDYTAETTKLFAFPTSAEPRRCAREVGKGSREGSHSSARTGRPIRLIGLGRAACGTRMNPQRCATSVARRPHDQYPPVGALTLH
jgi:hypothetical protein